MFVFARSSQFYFSIPSELSLLFANSQIKDWPKRRFNAKTFLRN